MYVCVVYGCVSRHFLIYIRLFLVNCYFLTDIRGGNLIIEPRSSTCLFMELWYFVPGFICISYEFCCHDAHVCIIAWLITAKNIRDKKEHSNRIKLFYALSHHHRFCCLSLNNNDIYSFLIVQRLSYTF